MPICEGSCRLTFLERQEVWIDMRSCKVLGRPAPPRHLYANERLLVGGKQLRFRLSARNERWVVRMCMAGVEKNEIENSYLMSTNGGAKGMT
ncbi:hypothetical protein Tco_0839922 [Tanacetum coccineum]|uniref:Uncharacterized protein n=1 Tax=Tanacetum coccineum TaxID=301880 RepID=A0ABQ5ASP4_9ASTR